MSTHHLACDFGAESGRVTLSDIEHPAGRSIKKLHIVGGGFCRLGNGP